MAMTIADVKKLPWSMVKISKKNGIECAIIEEQGIPFAFTDDGAIVFMADDAGFFSTERMAALFKDSGNFSDYDNSVMVATIVDMDLEDVPMSEVVAEIEAFSAEYAPTSVTDKVASVDWKAAAIALKPFIEAIQGLNQTIEIQNPNYN